MRAKKNLSNGSAEKTVKAIRRATRRRFAAEEKIRIVLEVIFPLRWSCVGMNASP